MRQLEWRWTRKALHMISWTLGLLNGIVLQSFNRPWAVVGMGIYTLVYVFFALTPPADMEKTAQEREDAFNGKWENAYQLGMKHGADMARLERMAPGPTLSGETRVVVLPHMHRGNFS